MRGPCSASPVGGGVTLHAQSKPRHGLPSKEDVPALPWPSARRTAFPCMEARAGLIGRGLWAGFGLCLCGRGTNGVRGDSNDQERDGCASGEWPCDPSTHDGMPNGTDLRALERQALRPAPMRWRWHALCKGVLRRGPVRQYILWPACAALVHAPSDRRPTAHTASPCLVRSP